MKLHIYSSEFANEEDAFKFADEMDYDDDDSIPELWSSIGATWLDSDFIETIYGAEKFSYTKTLLTDKDDLNKIKEKCPIEHNVLFLIFVAKDTSNEDFEPSENHKPLFVGTFDVTLS